MKTIPSLAIHCDWLTTEGHAVDAVGTITEARKYLEKRAPALVLLDLGLPDESGIDLLPELKDSEELISVVV